MRRDGDDRGSRIVGVARRVARACVRAGARAHRRALLDHLRGRQRAPRDARERRARLRARPRLPGRVSVHPRCLSVDVPRPSVDDAPVRRLRHGGGDERPLPLPHGARPDRALDGVRHADPHGLRLGSPAVAGRGGPRGCRGRLARRHGDALRRDPARRGLHLDDDQLPRGDRPCVLRLRRRGAGRLARPAAWHGADGHPQGVHRAEGVDLPARAVDAARRRHDRVLRARDAALPPGLDFRLPHPRGRLDRGPGARFYARGRIRLRGGGDRARPRRRRLRPAPLLLLQRAPRLLRGDREVQGRAQDLGARAARPLRRAERALAPHAIPHADRRRVAHRAAAGGEHRAHRARGARCGARRHAEPPHELVRRGARAPDGGRRAHRTSHPAGDRARVGRREHDRPTRRLATTSSV